MIQTLSRSCSGYSFAVLLACLALLAGCETEKMQQTDFVIQQNLFLQSLELVESAGVILQSPELDKDKIERAMYKMDQGLKQAFKVETSFLKKLDVRLPKLYAETFILGVENYRIGVEASDREKQLQGLELLGDWSKFWIQEKPSIQEKLLSMNG